MITVAERASELLHIEKDEQLKHLSLKLFPPVKFPLPEGPAQGKSLLQQRCFTVPSFPKKEAQCGVREIAYHPSLPLLALLQENNTVLLFYLPSSTLLPLELKDKRLGRLREVSWQPHQGISIAVSGETGISLFSLPSLELPKGESNRVSIAPTILSHRPEHFRVVSTFLAVEDPRGLAWDPSGLLLAYTTLPFPHLTLLNLWELATRKTQSFPLLFLQGVISMQWTRSGHHLILFCGDKRLYLLETKTWTHLSIRFVHPIEVFFVLTSTLDFFDNVIYVQKCFVTSADAQHVLIKLKGEAKLRTISINLPPANLGYRRGLSFTCSDTVNEMILSPDGERLCLLQKGRADLCLYYVDSNAKSINLHQRY